MIYEVRTYNLLPRGVPEFEKRFKDVLPARQKHSKLAGCWHTDIGPLNQVVLIWPYDDLNQRAEVLAAVSKDPKCAAQTSDLILNIETEIYSPAPFMRPMGKRKLGEFYEMRTYAYRDGSIPEVLNRWSKAIKAREAFSPLAACMFSELGGLNKLVHIWPYKTLDERQRIRDEAVKSGVWPTQTQEFLLRQENKLLVPAPFSPMH